MNVNENAVTMIIKTEIHHCKKRSKLKGKKIYLLIYLI